MKKKLTILFLLSVLSLAGCNQANTSNAIQSGSQTGGEITPGGGNTPGGGGSTLGEGGGTTPPSGDPVKVTVDKHTLSDGNPPISINSIGQKVSESTWNSFKNASSSKFNNHYNFTYEYYVGGQLTTESFTKNGYELLSGTTLQYYERIDNKLYFYQSGSEGYQRVASSYDFISRRSEVLAHEAYVHMFNYAEYTYFGEEDGMDGVFISNTQAYTSQIKFQGGYLTFLSYLLKSPLSRYQIKLSFETTIEIPKSYYYE